MGKQIDKALALHRAGRLAEAEPIYAGICRRDRDDAAAAFLLGVTRLALDRDAEALAPLKRAVALRPGHAESWRALGEVLDRLGRPGEAAQALQRAVALLPNEAPLHLALAAARLAAHDAAGALAACEAALALQPTLVPAHVNAGLALKTMGRTEAARAGFERALALVPDDVTALFNLGNLLGQTGETEEAERRLRRALALAPGFAPAQLALAHVMRETARTDGALDLVDEVLAAVPDHPIATVWRPMLRLPVVYREAEEVAARRASYAAGLDELARRVADAPARYLPGIASTRPFFLAYQGEDDRALQRRYAGIVEAVVGACVPPPPRPPARRAKLRVGVVSGYFRHHSVWKIPTRGWLHGLDRSVFEIVCYHTGGEVDEQTHMARGLADRFVQGPFGLEGWAGLIAADACDVLLYPEIGMDPMCVQLAALRLAPVQCNGLGHPVTSGLSTMDYALSSALMEPPDADSHYSERLVRLPGLGVFYDFLDLPPARMTRGEMGLAKDAFAFWCGQSLFKYQPRHDDTFARIAAAASRCRFVFIGFQAGDAVTKVFAARLARAFGAYGLEARDFCLFLPRQSAAGFVAAAGCCDAVLDSIGWSGFNSTMESLTHDLPVVTVDGAFMRGRHSAAILRRMGLQAWIATTPEDFVAEAVRLATDSDRHRRSSAQVAAAKPALLRDAEPMRALGEALARAVAEATDAGRLSTSLASR